MSDFYLDFRKTEICISREISDMMRYYEDIAVRQYEMKEWSLFLARGDDRDLWGPYGVTNGKIFVAIAGRIALEKDEWEEARRLEGEGGLACKAIYRKYKTGGIEKLKELNGGFVVFICDYESEIFYIITDRCGMYPCFTAEMNKGGLVFCSHPDIIAKALGEQEKWDLLSMAEFLATGKVSFPYTYYKNIKGLEFGSIHTIKLTNGNPTYDGGRKYFNLNFKLDKQVTEWDLAKELAASFRKAMNRRVLPMFGQSAISLSGGLDSRALLCAVEEKKDIWTFCFYNEENLEYALARQIAQKAGVRFFPVQRTFDHYGDYAEMGIRITGGMGDFGNNHYLGFKENFKVLNIDNIIAGFYCDYLFKALVLNKKVNKYIKTEKFAKFDYENYMPNIWFETEYSEGVRERLNRTLPDELKKDESDLGRLKIEERRLFPLCYEPDHMETLVPEKTMGWYLPTIDNDIIDTYLKIPPKFKLNTSMYSMMVEFISGKEISRITNINTGARVNASKMELIYHQYLKGIKKRILGRETSIATDESWPNWRYYIDNSKKIHSLWYQKNEYAREILVKIMGKDPYEKRIQDYKMRDLKLFLRLLTLKLWFDQRLKKLKIS